MKRKLLALVIALALVAGGFTLVRMKKEGIAALAKPRPVIPVVRVAAVTEGALEVTAHYLGIVEPVTRTDLSARITAAILRVEKREGDPVHEGEELVVLDDRELQEKHNGVRAEMLAARQKQAGARSTYATQEAIYLRDQKLFAAGAISREALERSKAIFDNARSVLDAYTESIKGMAMNAAAAR
ncbi:MAG TPA: hypothetical protein DDY32_07205, partial [Desulfobulbaceae bacterium]|nr:hypothetical protein [Desulfobulbaceae bacterium]